MYVVLSIVLLAGIELACYFSKAFAWIFFGILFFVFFFFLVFVFLIKAKNKHPERKKGKVWQQIEKAGKLINIIPSECAPNTDHSNKEEIERRSHLKLPNFKVISCKETKPDFVGEYFGQMEIEFCEDFSIETINKLRSEHSGNRIKLDLSDGDGDWWNIKLSLDSRTALISYGYINHWFI